MEEPCVCPGCDQAVELQSMYGSGDKLLCRRCWFRWLEGQEDLEPEPEHHEED